MNKSLIFAVALTILASLSLIVANEVSEKTTDKQTEIYMGVDAKDEEAVNLIQRELNEEKWNELFKDVDLDSLDFSGFDTNFAGKPADKLKEAFRALLDMFKLPIQETSSEKSD